MAEAPHESTSTCDFNDSSGLDQTYTVFGEVVRGMEVVDKIVAAPRDNPQHTILIMVME